MTVSLGASSGDRTRLTGLLWRFSFVPTTQRARGEISEAVDAIADAIEHNRPCPIAAGTRDDLGWPRRARGRVALDYLGAGSRTQHHGLRLGTATPA